MVMRKFVTLMLQIFVDWRSCELERKHEGLSEVGIGVWRLTKVKSEAMFDSEEDGATAM